MSISGISGINNGLERLNIDKEKEQVNGGQLFQDFLNKAMNLVETTNELETKAEKVGLDFIMGKTDNIHNVMIAQEKANLALQFTVQVRDKLLDAYNEIMRMPI